MSDTVIILQDECILAAEGKAGRMPKLTHLQRIPVEGYGDVTEQWKKALVTYQETRHPDRVKLVLPANYSMARMTQIPYASGKQFNRIAENILLESGVEGIVDYAAVSANKNQGICLCCGSVSEEFLTQLIDLCTEVSLQVESISVPMEGYLRLLSQERESQGKTAIYLLFDENSVTSILYKEGIYYYSTRSRIFSERGTFDFGTEIVRIISGIRQFYAAAKENVPITDLFYAGCEDDDFEVCLQGIEQMNLKVHPLYMKGETDIDVPAGDWLVCLGSLITGKKDINLYKKWTETHEEITYENQNLKNQMIFPLVTFAVCLAVFAGMAVWNLSVSGQMESVRTWIEDHQSEYVQAAQRQTYSQKLETALRQMEQTEQNLATYPDLTSDMIARIVDVSGRDMDVHVQAVDMSTGTLDFNAVSRQVIDIPGYVSKLDGTGLFESVNYTGYSYADGEYTLALSCILKAEDGEGES